jgi:hypothetical protein
LTVRWAWVVAAAVLAAALLGRAPERAVRRLPAGVVELHSEIVADTDVEGDPAGTVLRMAPDFEGRAAIVVRGNGVHIRRLTVEGNRDVHEVPAGLPGYDVPFARFTRGNGVLAAGVDGLVVEGVTFRGIGGFAVLASRSRHVTIRGVSVRDSGSRNAAGKNNTTGGVLLEEGTADFAVLGCDFENVLGNGVWTHSLYTSPRNVRGRIAGNRFRTIGRDAVQAGHAMEVAVDRNEGRDIGFPAEIVDATPAALDTAGNVERSSYAYNRFDHINGKCIDLDGFHDGEVRGNVCTGVGGYGIVFNNTNPDMQSRNIRVVGNELRNVMYGGIFVIGTGHVVMGNRLTNLNTSHCDGCGYVPGEPDMLHSGIYLGRRAERPAVASGNVVEGNEISGYKMKARCVGSAPGVSGNVVRGNRCSE